MFRRSAMLVVVVAVLFTALVASNPPRAEAGSNGQQINVFVSCPYAPALAEVRVRGHNQYPGRDEVTWTARPNRKSVVTYGWWWVGWVYVQYKYAGINPYTNSEFPWYGTWAYIPKTFSRDIYAVVVDSGQDCRPY